MLRVQITPPGGEFIEFLRITMSAYDDGLLPISTPPWEIVYTTDGSIPAVDIAGNPLGTSKKSISPIRNFPIGKPTTVRCFARRGSTTSEIVSAYFDIVELLAKNEIRTVTDDITNYTLAISNGDITKNDRGLYDVVWGMRKAAQDIRQVLQVENVPEGRPAGQRTLPRFGSALNRILGAALPVGIARGQIHTAIYNAVTYLAELQRAENVPDTEQIRRIRSLSVDTESDLTRFRYNILVELVTGETVQESGTIVTTLSE